MNKITSIALMAAMVAGATEFRVSSDHADALYRLDETAVFTVEAYETNGVPLKGKCHVRLDNFGDRIFFEKDVDLEKEPKFTVSGKMDRPGFLMLRVSKAKSQAKLFGVGYEPEKLRPYRECPADFDEFWANSIKKYNAECPGPIKATKVDPGKVKGRDLFELEIPALGSRTVWGYFSAPKDLSKGPYPLHIHLPGAGPASFSEGGSENAFNLFVNVHYYQPKRGIKYKGPESNAMQKAEDEAYAKKYPVKMVRYTQCGIAVSREDYFYYASILAINRAIDWAAAHEGVDLKRVKYSGGSQGGGLGLIVTGLNKHIRKAYVTVPALTDHLCFKIDQREAGWPRLIDAQLPENRAAAEKWAPYFDGVYFAQRITVPIRFNVGFADTVCPPHAGWTAYNVCPSKDKDMLYGIGQGHPPLPEISRKLQEWWNKD